MIKVWADRAESGMLDKYGERGSAFAYFPGVDGDRAVSVTMPVQLPSRQTAFGLLPIFDMNLPEGALRERLRVAFAKASGVFDDLALLAVVGRSQVGRVRYTGDQETLTEEVPFQSVDEILASRRERDLFQYLIEKFAPLSGISGVQPKILVRDENAFGADTDTGLRLSPSHKGATHIVKFWEPQEFPQLAANEFFCLKVAERCGLEVPIHRLAEDGMALVIDRFDLRSDGTYRGFEDFCVLNARRTDEKYRGSYETNVLKRFGQFAHTPFQLTDSERLFTLMALNCALRNGDAHLKNFGILYDEVWGEARLAPVYDVVTTTVYIAQDKMALTLNGSTRWPTGKELRQFGETKMIGPPAKIRRIFQTIADAISDTVPEVEAYRSEHPAFAQVGKRMVEEWETGRRLSLGIAG